MTSSNFLAEFEKKSSTLQEALSHILIGKKEIIQKTLAVLFSGGNLLLEDAPGTGKTTFAKAFARLIGTEEGKNIRFSRIQGTPDLLPSDITGIEIYHPKEENFRFYPGPIFTNILLADELNRTTPKVQSALLEAMAEKQVTVNGITRRLPPFFFFIAAQNPESEGVYPLPLAQMDRFSCVLHPGIPDMQQELRILQEGGSENRLPALHPVITVNEILFFQQEIKKIPFAPALDNALVKIAEQTRRKREFNHTLSTRALLVMKAIAKSYAALHYRAFVTDQDILELSEDVFAHRTGNRVLLRQITREILAATRKTGK